MRPLFIVLEALDGVGKTTVARLLAAELDGVPMNTPGDQIRRVSDAVLDGLGENQAARCLFYASSVIARGAEARRVVRSGVSVVMDRYWLSTISYARARGLRSSLRDVEDLVVPPDLTVLMVMDEEERQSRLERRGLTRADLETMDPSFRDRVLSEMRSAERSPALRPSLVIDVTGLEPAAVVERLRLGIEEALPDLSA